MVQESEDLAALEAQRAHEEQAHAHAHANTPAKR